MPEGRRHGSRTPGLTGVDHFGFTVPDLDQAKSFLVDVLGLRVPVLAAAFERDETWMARAPQRGPGDPYGAATLLPLRGKGVFEVFEYSAPDQRRVGPRNSDIGGHHVSFYVNDLDAAVAYLRQQGVTVLGDPTGERQANEGQRRDIRSLGMQFELVSYPGGTLQRPGWREALASDGV